MPESTGTADRRPSDLGPQLPELRRAKAAADAAGKRWEELARRAYALRSVPQRDLAELIGIGERGLRKRFTGQQPP